MRNILLLMLSLAPLFCSPQQAPGLSKAVITSDRPAKDFHGAMPAGNGDIGINAWVEQNGDLLFYISKTDAYDDNNRLLKLGRIRVTVSPNPFSAGTVFRQQLVPERAEITAQSETEGHLFKMLLWVDANNPVIHLEMNGDKKFVTRVQLEDWRRKEYEVTEPSHSDVYNAGVDGSSAGIKTIQYPDSIFSAQRNRITWYHHNKHSCWPFTLQLQGLRQFSETHQDPLLNNIFGATVSGTGLVQSSDTSLVSSHAANAQNVSIIVHGENATTPEKWTASLLTLKNSLDKKSPGQYRAAHLQWWKQFWNRSFINIHTSSDTGDIITRSYILQRYMVACSGRGEGWIKYNGTIFTPPYTSDPDYRKWGPAQWFQNARLVYWPLVSAGDFDLLSPFYATFLRALPLVKQRTKLYYKHDGAFFSETAYAWGTYANADYGYKREGYEDGYIVSNYIRRHWTGGLELTAMMLDQYHLTQSKAFLTDTLLPIASEVVEFYDQHWKRGADGKIRFDPAQSLETWQTAVNPMPEIAGLQFVLSELLQVPNGAGTASQRAAWQKTLADLPSLPEDSRHLKLLPADSVTVSSNSENPELYAIFPFRLFGVGKPSLDMAKNTFSLRRNRESYCWNQDDAQAAFLGLTDTAARGVAKRMTNWNKDYAFPAVWGPGNDEMPDLDHGGVGQLALQKMLMQTDGDSILLFPAWPKNWDVSFKLKAPAQTTVEGTFAGGKLTQLVVTPASRRRDVLIMNGE